MQAGAFNRDDGTEEDVLETIKSLRNELSPLSGRSPQPQSVEGHLLTLAGFVSQAGGISVATEIVESMSSLGPQQGAVAAADRIADSIDSSLLPDDLVDRNAVVTYVDHHPKETVAVLLGWANRASDASAAVLDNLSHLRHGGGLGSLIAGGTGLVLGTTTTQVGVAAGVGGLAGVVFAAILALLANFRKRDEIPE